MKPMIVQVWRGERRLAEAAQMTAAMTSGQARGTGQWAGHLVMSEYVSKGDLLVGEVSVEIPGVGRFPIHVWRAGTSLARFYGVGAAPGGLE